jgi:hypothetical protein
MSKTFNYPNNPLGWQASPKDFTGDNVLGIYAVETTKRFVPGTRYTTWDGREYRYARSTGAAQLYAAHGCQFSGTGYTAITTFGVAASIGDTGITIPAATHAALAEDELAGGYVIIFDGASDYYTTTRMIVGNEAAAANAAFTVTLDAPLSYAITAATSKCETYTNPWNDIIVANNDALAFAGVPAASVSAAAQYFWVQTKGIAWVAPQAGVGLRSGLGVTWRHDGSIDDVDTSFGVTVPAGSTSQFAGYCVEGSQAGNGPLIMLQG